MSDKKRILTRLAVLLVSIFVLDFAVGAALKHLFFAKRTGFDARANYVINKANEDILVFGSSKASEHYDTRILRDSLKMSVYNAGRDLSYIHYHYALLQAVLKRYTPKLIILDTRANEFEKFEYGENLDRLNVLLPFYDSHPEIREVCLLRGKYEKFKLFSKTYPYNSLILSGLVELLPLKRFKKDDSVNGYIAKYGQYKGSKPPYNVKDDVDALAAGYYKKFVLACKAKNIKLVVAFSPLYQKIDPDKNRNVAYIERVCKENNVPLFSYLIDDQFNNPKYFFDDRHLNREGSVVYTNRIITQLRGVLKQ
jgi:hypothetical protein